MQLSIKYRPKKFAEVVGHDATKRILINSILINRIPKAFLTSGLRGSGKTTFARLYAAALNCENFNNDICGECPSCVDVQNGSHLSVIEMDAASNNGVDDVRGLEKILDQKVIHSYRVIILDEAHMLSKQAQAALLKVLEELPKNNVFFLVTTEPEKLEDTIRSRCLSLPLRPLHPRDVAESIRRTLKAEEKAYEDSFVDTLSLYGGGSLRDVQQILEQIIIMAGNDPLNTSFLEESVGVISTEKYKDLANILVNKDPGYALEEVERWYSEGVDLEMMYMTGIPTLMRDFMMYLSGACSNGVYLYSGLSVDGLTRNLTLTIDDIRRIIHEWEVSYSMIKNALNVKVMFETFLAKICV